MFKTPLRVLKIEIKRLAGRQKLAMSLSEQIKFTHHTQGPIISQAPTAAWLMITAKPATANKYFA